MTPLKAIFEKSRNEKNIDVILPVLLSTHLYVVGKKVQEDAEPDFFITSSLTPDRFCVTVAESPEFLSKIKSAVDIMEMSGKELLERMGPAFEIVVVYADGGDYLTREQLDWFRKTLAEQKVD